MNRKDIPDRIRKPIEDSIALALKEDVGRGDITSIATISQHQQSRGNFIVKDPGVISGLAVAGMVFQEIDREIEFTYEAEDGQEVSEGQSVARIRGKTRSILQGERTALNFMQRMSGISTLTAEFKKAVSHTPCRILDTRKTAPGLRVLDKWSVELGGGFNHRMDLSEMILIKENHIRAAGGVEAAIKLVLAEYGKSHEIEIEVSSLEELNSAIRFPVNRIMLDNFTIPEIREAVNICRGKIPLEASGRIGLTNVREIAETGVDFISVGSLTHSVRALDISLLLSDKL